MLFGVTLLSVITVLGEYQTNNRSISMQLMRQFLECHSIVTAYSNLDFDAPSLQDLKIIAKEDGNLQHLIPLCSFRVDQKSLKSVILSKYYTFLSGGGRLRCLPRDDTKSITDFLSFLFPSDSIFVSHIVKSYLRLRTTAKTITRINSFLLTKMVKSVLE